MEIVLLMALAFMAAYLWTMPMRAERVLKHASLTQLQEAARRDPNNPRILYYLGLRAQQADQSDLAMALLERAANLSPDDQDIWLTWARAAGAAKGPSATVTILNTYIKHNPQNAGARLLVAQAWQRLNNERTAFDQATLAAKYEPSNQAAWAVAASAAMDLRDFVTAEADYRHAAALDPRDWLSVAGEGDALFEEGRYPEAAAAYRRATGLAPQSAVTHLALGRTLLHEATQPAEVEAARRELRQATALQATLTPLGVYTLDLAMGQSYEQEGRWREALPWLIRAEPLAPAELKQAVDVHFELARVYRRLGNGTAAAREVALHQQKVDYNLRAFALENHLEVAPHDIPARLALARLYAAHGFDFLAVGMYRSILALVPGQADAQKEFAALGRRLSTRQHPRNP